MGRKKALFETGASEPFKLSRNKLELFLRCPCCFYLDRKLGISPPSQPPFTLNNAVDALLKKDFDSYRDIQKPHPIMKKASLNAVPFSNALLNQWQDYHSGLQYLMPDINTLVFGAVDDIWKSNNGELIIVDYKATSSDKEITLDDEWKKSYKHQVEIYQWLLKNNGFEVSDRAYFVYANAQKHAQSFNGALSFNITLLPYDGNCDWVEGAVRNAHACLASHKAPKPYEKCEWCAYLNKVHNSGIKFNI